MKRQPLSARARTRVALTVRDTDWMPTLNDPEVIQYLQEEVGDEGLEMARFLQDHPRVSGVEIQEHFSDRKPSAVRKVLYKMMEAHAAEYDKDTDAKGWETFFWDLDLMEIKLILRRRWADELLSLKKQLKFEEDHQFYACTKQHRRIMFEDAMEIGFKCPVCQEGMELVRNNQVIDAIKARVAELAVHFPDA